MEQEQVESVLNSISPKYTEKEQTINSENQSILKSMPDRQDTFKTDADMKEEDEDKDEILYDEPEIFVPDHQVSIKSVP